jgi:hypothetical protein
MRRLLLLRRHALPGSLASAADVLACRCRSRQVRAPAWSVWRPKRGDVGHCRAPLSASSTGSRPFSFARASFRRFSHTLLSVPHSCSVCCTRRRSASSIGGRSSVSSTSPNRGPVAGALARPRAGLARARPRTVATPHCLRHLAAPGKLVGPRVDRSGPSRVTGDTLCPPASTNQLTTDTRSAPTPRIQGTHTACPEINYGANDGARAHAAPTAPHERHERPSLSHTSQAR